MPKKFLAIVDPLARLNVSTDTTLALMAEAGQRGVENFACEIGDIFLQEGKVHFHAAPVSIKPGYQKAPDYVAPKAIMNADQFRVIFMRKDPPLDEHFMASLLMLRVHNPQKTLVLNNPDGLLVANEKLFGLQVAHQFFPSTLVSSNKADFDSFVKTHKKVVFKPLFGAGGSGVMVFEEGDLNLYSALEILSASYSRPIIAQSYVKNARSGDKRILLLGGDPLGAVLRVPHQHDHRANFHAGGTPESTKLTPREKEICLHLKPSLLKLGLHFVGIDVIDGFLTEINVTSPTCILQMEAGLSAKVIDYIEGLIA